MLRLIDGGRFEVLLFEENKMHTRLLRRMFLPLFLCLLIEQEVDIVENVAEL